MKDKEKLKSNMVEVEAKDDNGGRQQNAASREENHMVQLLQVKTVLMGDVGAGKTSLLNALRYSNIFSYEENILHIAKCTWCVLIT